MYPSAPCNGVTECHTGVHCCIYIISVFACSSITLEGTSERHEVLGVYENITDGRSCGDGHDVYMQAWPRQDFYLYYLTEVSGYTSRVLYLARMST